MDFILSTPQLGGGKMPILRTLLDGEGGNWWDENRR
jgi:hypothetical protein